MIRIQILLLLLLLILAYLYFTRIRTGAIDRILGVVFIGCLMILIIQPSLSTWIANLIGVGRGADLLIYLFSVFVLYCLVLIYTKIRKIEQKLIHMVQGLAIETAVEPKAEKQDSKEQLG